MLTLSLLLVISSGLCHALWNFLTKKNDDKAVFLWIIIVPSNVLLLVYAVREIAEKGLPWQGVLLAGASMLVQGVYGQLLARAYKQGDLSQVYPIMRGTSIVLVPLLGVTFLGEALNAWGWAGIGCMLVGFAVMSGWLPYSRAGQLSMRPVLLALSVGLCTTMYTLIDKLLLGYLSPLSLLGIANIGLMLGLTPAVRPLARVREAWRQYPVTITAGAILSPGSYLLFLIAMQAAPVSSLAPLREIGIVFGTLLGLALLGERPYLRRLLASLVITAGIGLIAWHGL